MIDPYEIEIELGNWNGAEYPAIYPTWRGLGLDIAGLRRISLASVEGQPFDEEYRIIGDAHWFDSGEDRFYTANTVDGVVVLDQIRGYRSEPQLRIAAAPFLSWYVGLATFLVSVRGGALAHFYLGSSSTVVL